MIFLSLTLNNPSLIREFMEQLIPTENFLTEMTLVEDNVWYSIENRQVHLSTQSVMKDYSLKQNTM